MAALIASLFTSETKEGEIRYRNITKLFPEGQKVCWIDGSNLVVAGVVTGLYQQKSIGLNPGYTSIQCKVLLSNGKGFFGLTFPKAIGEFSGSRSIDEVCKSSFPERKIICLTNHGDQSSLSGL
mmetsp:Transcript_28019/g.47499  ORF Transcript_28019/g.47499 Transcript_28019/m.47499 type:complete len:124 (+) Transcript_28019:51-422(+)